MTVKRVVRNGQVATERKARKSHTCKECPDPIEPGSYYWEIVGAGAGKRNNLFPDRIHTGDCFESYFGGK